MDKKKKDQLNPIRLALTSQTQPDLCSLDALLNFHSFSCKALHCVFLFSSYCVMPYYMMIYAILYFKLIYQAA